MGNKRNHINLKIFLNCLKCLINVWISNPAQSLDSRTVFLMSFLYHIWKLFHFCHWRFLIGWFSDISVWLIKPTIVSMYFIITPKKKLSLAGFLVPLSWRWKFIVTCTGYFFLSTQCKLTSFGKRQYSWDFPTRLAYDQAHLVSS